MKALIAGGRGRVGSKVADLLESKGIELVSGGLDDGVDYLDQQIEDILHRAQAARRVRSDLAPGDIVNLIWFNGRMIDATRTAAPDAWRRQLHLMLDAYRADRAHALPEPPMTNEQLYAAMVDLNP